MNKVHELKICPEFLSPIEDGRKTFEVRYNDRNYEIGDTLELREYDERSEQYGERVLTAKVLYVLEGGRYGVKEGYCAMGIEIINKKRR